jgi:hypothetical protein
MLYGHLSQMLQFCPQYCGRMKFKYTPLPEDEVKYFMMVWRSSRDDLKF